MKKTDKICYVCGKQNLTTDEVGLTKKLLDKNTNKFYCIELSDANPNYKKQDNGVLYNGTVTSIAFYPSSRQGEYVMPETLETVPANTFYDKSNLTSVVIGKNVTEIGSNAFYNCANLASVTFTAGDKELVVGDYAFGFSSATAAALKTIKLPERTVTLGAGAFMNNTALTKVEFPASLTEIRSSRVSTLAGTRFDVFENCVSLDEVVFADGNPAHATQDGIIYSKDTNGDPTNLMFAPLGRTGEVRVPKTVRRVLENSFYLNTSITQVIFEDHDKETNPETGKEEYVPLVIEKQAFYQCTIKEVVLPRGLITLSEECFKECGGLTSITIPNTVQSIQMSAFYQCTHLEEVLFEEGNDETPLRFEDGAFLASGNSSTAVPNGGKGIFYNCISLTKVELPERTTYIGVGAFATVPITSITIPANVETIAPSAFAKSKLVTVNIAPDSKLKVIGGNAFGNSTSLTSINLPEGLEQLGAYAFAYTGLTSIDIPAGVSVIGGEYTALVENQKNPTTFVAGHAFFRAPLTKVVLHEGTTSIPASTFTYTGAIEKLEIPQSVTEIGANAFDYSAVREIVFADNSDLKTIGQYAFSNTPALRKVDFGKNPKLERLTAYSFHSSGMLESIVIPASVQYIDYQAFYGCMHLSSVTWETDDDGNVLPSQLKIFGSTANGVAAYTSGAASLFGGSLIKSITIPESEAQGGITFGKGVFAQCSELTTVYLPKSVSSLNQAFLGSPSLTTVVIPEDNDGQYSIDNEIQSIVDGEGSLMFVFGEFTGDFQFPAESNAQSIGEYAFKGQTGLKKIVLPASLREIGQYAFKDCTNLEEVVVPENSLLTTIGNYAFNSCSSLSKFKFENAEHLSTIGNYAFCYSGLVSVDLSKSAITAFVYYAANGTPTSSNNIFEGCKDLVSFAFPKAVKSSGSCILKGCSSLTSVTFPDALEVISMNAFDGTALTSVTIPYSVKLIQNTAFGHCTSLQEVRFEKVPEGKKHEAIIFNGSATNGIFVGCSFAHIALPSDRDVYLGTGALAGTQISSIEWGQIKYIADSALSNTAFTEITLPVAEYRSLSITTKYTADGETMNELTLAGNRAAAQSVLSDCANLQTVKFAEGFNAKVLGIKFFYNCPQLTSVDFTNASSLLYLANNIFQNDVALETVDLTPLTQLTSLGSGTVSFANDVPNKPNVTASTNTYLFQGCTALSKVILPESVTIIPGYVFDGCKSITNAGCIEGIERVTIIGNYAFEASGLVTFSLGSADNPSPLTSLGSNVFAWCEQLQTVDIGYCTSLAGLSGNAFLNCTALETVKLPTSIGYLGTNTFQNSGLISIDLSETQVHAFGTSKAKDNASVSTNSYVFADCYRLESVKLPVVPITIGAYTFQGCFKLSQEGFDLSNVTLIGNYAFANTAFTEVTIPAGLTTFGSWAFDGCDATFDDSVSAKFKLQGAYLVDTSTNKPVMRVGNPAQDGVITITQNSEMFAYGLNGVKADKLVLLESVTAIPDYAFYGSDIAEIEFPVSSLTKVGKNAFTESTFDTVKLPASVTDVGDGAFENSYVRVVDFSELDGSDYDDVTKIPVPFGEDNKSSGNNKSKINMFKDSHVHKVILPENMTAIRDSWFQNTTELEEVNIPDGIVVIGKMAFQGTGLKSLVLPANDYTWGGTQLRQAAFADSMLEEITYLGNCLFKYIFANATNLKRVRLAEGVLLTTPTSTDDAISVFEGCSSLTTVTTEELTDDTPEGVVVPESFSAIPMNTFKNCSSLDKITLHDNITSFGANSFENTGFVTFTVPENITEFGRMSPVFTNCAKLETLICNNSVGNQVSFINNPVLKYVKLPNATGFSANAFNGCPSLKAVWVPKGYTSFTQNTFIDWTGEQTIYCEMTSFQIGSIVGVDWIRNTNAAVKYGYTEEAFLQEIGRTAD